MTGTKLPRRSLCTAPVALPLHVNILQVKMGSPGVVQHGWHRLSWLWAEDDLHHKLL